MEERESRFEATNNIYSNIREKSFQYNNIIFIREFKI